MSKFLGIDIGTTATKYSLARGVDDPSVRHRRRDSPSIARCAGIEPFFDPNPWIACVEDVLTECQMRAGDITFIACISPCLTVFDRAEPSRAVGLPYWKLEEIDQGNSLLEDTLRRLELMSKASSTYTDPAWTDLVGYIHACLAGTHTLNSVSAAELGFTSLRQLNQLEIDGLSNPVVVSPFAQSTTLGIGSTLCAGSPDSYAMILASQCRTPGEVVVYAGTFGSSCQLLVDPMNIDMSQSISPIYRWTTSSPGFGPYVASLALERYPNAGTMANAIATLARSALDAPAASRGTLQLLPIWDGTGRPRGSHSLMPATGMLDCERDRSLLEALPLALLARGTVASRSPRDSRPQVVVGGVAQNSDVLQVLASTLGRTCVSPEDGGARGALWGASASAAVDLLALSSHPSSIRHPSDVDDAIDGALARARSHYQQIMESP